jgi:hypothetical protein
MQACFCPTVGAIRGAQEVSSSFWRASSLEITAKGEVQVHAFPKMRGADLCELDFRSEVFPRKTQDSEHVDLALFELLPAEFNRVGAA